MSSKKFAGFLAVASTALVGVVVFEHAAPAQADHDTAFDKIDVNLDGGDIDATWAVRANSLLFFDSNDVTHGSELWHINTDTGFSKMVVDLFPGTASSSPSDAVAIGNRVVFNATTPTGRFAFVSDGTAAGTTQLGDWAMDDPVVFQNSVFFATSLDSGHPSGDGGLGTELYRWAPSTGIELAADINPGPGSSHASSLVVVPGSPGQLFFLATVGTKHIVRYDAAGSELADLSTASGPRELVAAGGDLYALDSGLYHIAANASPFDASNVTNIGGVSLFRSYAGTPAGLYVAGGAGSPYYDVLWTTGSNPMTQIGDLCTVGPVTPFGNSVLFNTTTTTGCGSSNGYLALANGPTTTSTLLSAERVFPNDILPSPAGGQALFFADDAANNPVLWRTDGTLANTAEFATVSQPVRSSVNLYDGNQNRWLFLASTPEAGVEWWTADGDPANTAQIGSVSDVTADSFAEQFTAVNDKVIFAAEGDAAGFEPWVYDPSDGSTSLLADLDGDNASEPNYFTSTGSSVMFETNYSSVYVSDGETATEFLNGDNDSWGEFLAVGDRFFIALDDIDGDNELYTTDGTAAGTTLVKNIDPIDSSGPGDFVAFGDKLVFGANDGVAGYEPWISDGTNAGTIPLGDLTPGPDSSRLYQHAIAGDLLYLLDDDTSKLFVTDGTPTGTSEVVVTNGVTTATDLNQIIAVDNRLFARESSTRDRFWVIDGNTISLIEPGFEVDLVDAGAFNGLLIGDGLVPGTGGEEEEGDDVSGVFVSDGTASGTMMLDLGDTSFDVNFVAAGTHAAFFSGHVVESDSAGEYQLWRTEGTSATTSLVTPLGEDSQGTPKGELGDMWLAGDLLFVAGRFSEIGREAIVLDVGPHVPAAPGTPTATLDGVVADVSWAAPSDDGGADITQYTVTASPGGATCTTSVLTCAIGGLSVNTSYTFTVVATNRAGDSAPSAASNAVTPEAEPEPEPEPDAIIPVAPARYWDTRNEPTFDNQFSDTGRLDDDTFHKITIAGRGDVPANATGIVGNLTVIFPDGPGYATMYPCTTEPPNASTLNYNPGDVTANNAIVPLDANGDVCVYTLRGADYALDINGYTPDDSPIVGIAPARYLETRPTGNTFDGNALGAGRTPDDTFIEVQIAGRGSIPANATAAIVNATIIFPDGPGYATLYPCGDIPDASNINYTAGTVTPNGAITQLSPTGTLCIYTLRAADVIIDVSGYAPAGTTTLTTQTPARFADTRPGQPTIDGQAQALGRNTAGNHIEIQITGRNNIPTTATAAIINLAIINPSGPGYATLYPCGTLPGTSNLNHTAAGVVKANNAITKLSPTGTICAYTLTDADLIIDITGYLS